MSTEIKVNRVDDCIIEFPVIVETPDDSVAIYFAERTAFFAAPAQEHHKDKPFFTTDACSIHKCRPLSKGSSVTFVRK